MEDRASWRDVLLYRHGDFCSVFVYGPRAVTSRGSTDFMWWRDILSLETKLSSVGCFGSCIK